MKEDRYDDENYNPFSTIDGDEPTVEELAALYGLAAA
jgi:hypothetical protein